MRLTAEERVMYEVMTAIYESGIPMNFKGSMVLKACLAEAGYLEDVRHTVDIDGNWYSTVAPTEEQMVESIQNALREKNIELDVSLYRMYGEGRSAGFELANHSTGEVLFTMDIDVNRPFAATKVYEIEEIKFRGLSVIQMLADKVSSVSTDKVFRRIKDVVDLYYFSKVFEFDKNGVQQALHDSGRTLDSFDAFLNRSEELRHSYEKFRFAGDINKPTFDDVYHAVKEYIKDIL